MKKEGGVRRHGEKEENQELRKRRREIHPSMPIQLSHPNNNNGNNERTIGLLPRLP